MGTHVLQCYMGCRLGRAVSLITHVLEAYSVPGIIFWVEGIEIDYS